MKNTNCLNEQDLTLHYYGELPAHPEQARHLADCLLCRKRFSALGHDLATLPELHHEPDSAAGTRMAARVMEQLNRPRRNWMPALGASAIAAVALVVTFTDWSPQHQQLQTVQPATQALATLNLNEDMPDIDFFEDLELLKELDLLSQIEGV
ncbi:MAG: anti-sigma factor family protein [Desulfuromonadales bacterium]